MDQRTAPSSPMLPAVPTLATAAGTLVACVAMFVPIERFEAVVGAIGVATPIGTATQMLFAALGGMVAGGIAWAILDILLGDGASRVRGLLQRAGTRFPARARADAHPDAPARAPLNAARELGTPFLEVRAAAAAPEPAPVPPARQPIIRPRERLETFALRPPVVPVSPPARPDDAIATPGTDATIHALLERLERGVSQRGTEAAAPPPPPSPPPPPAPAPSIGDTLAELRRLATR